MSVLRVILLYPLTALWLFDAAEAAFNLAGPYTLKFKRIEHCEDEGTQELNYHEKLNKEGKYEYSYNGDFWIPDDTNGDLELTAKIAKKLSTGGWGLNYYEYKAEKLCEMLRDHMSTEFNTYTSKYLKVNSTCPVPGGLYKAEKWIIFIDQLPMKELEYGEYRVEAIVMRKDQRVGCITIYMDVEEKPREI